MNIDDIEKIVDRINKLVDEKPFEYIQKKSTWFSEKLVSPTHKDGYPYLNPEYNDFFLDTTISRFTKDAGLKFAVNIDMNDPSKDVRLISTWIIKIWGGIKGIKNPTINSIVENIDSNVYSFENISSWSKVHSFKNIDTDIIYDSKVIYSLNWLILQLENKHKFFLQPMGRNKRLMTFPIESLINYRHSDLIDMEKRGEKATQEVYYIKKQVYTRYRNIIHSINKELWGSETIDLGRINQGVVYMKDYPFFTEMLLFNMADDVIFSDVRKKVKIEIEDFRS